MTTPSYPSNVTLSCNETGTCQTEVNNTTEVWRTLMAVYLGVILLLSVAFNGTLCLVFYKKPHLLSISNCFVLNLACCQLCMSLLVLPFSLFAVVSYDLVYSGVWCEIQGFFNTVIIVTVQLALLIISLDRNYAIMNSLRYPTVFTQSLCTFLICMSWTFGIVISILPLLHSEFGSYTFHPHQFLCTLNWTSQSIYLIVFSILAFAVPIAIQSFCYIKIFKAAVGHTKRRTKVHPLATKSSARSFREETSDSSESIEEIAPEQVRSVAAECKAVRTIFILAVAYCVCWVPYFADSFLTRLNGLMLPNLSAAAICFIFSTGILNPLIYAYMNRITRREIGRFLCGNQTLNESDDFVSTSNKPSLAWATQQRIRSRSPGGPNKEMGTIFEETEVDSGICETRSHCQTRPQRALPIGGSISDTSQSCNDTVRSTEIVLRAADLLEIKDEQMDMNASGDGSVSTNCVSTTNTCNRKSVTKITTKSISKNSPWNAIKTKNFLELKQRVRRSNSESNIGKAKGRKRREYGSFLSFENDVSDCSNFPKSRTSRGTDKRISREISVDHVQSISITTTPKILKFRVSVSDWDRTVNNVTVESNLMINNKHCSTDVDDSESSSEQYMNMFDDVNTSNNTQHASAETLSSMELKMIKEEACTLPETHPLIYEINSPPLPNIPTQASPLHVIPKYVLPYRTPDVALDNIDCMEGTQSPDHTITVPQFGQPSKTLAYVQSHLDASDVTELHDSANPIEVGHPLVTESAFVTPMLDHPPVLQRIRIQDEPSGKAVSTVVTNVPEVKTFGEHYVENKTTVDVGEDINV